MKIRPVGAALSHADRRKDKHDETNCRFSQFCGSSKKRERERETEREKYMLCLECYTPTTALSIR